MELPFFSAIVPLNIITEKDAARPWFKVHLFHLLYFISDIVGTLAYHYKTCTVGLSKDAQD